MYSLVLMMAMSHGAAAPGWQSGEVDLRGTNFIHATAHEHYRGRRCHGCCGGGYGGCCGGGGGCGGGEGCCGGGYAMGGYGGGYGGYATTYSMPYGSYAGMPGYGGYSAGYYAPGMYNQGFVTPGETGTITPGANPAGRGAEGDRGTNSPGSRPTGTDENRRESFGPAPATLRVTLPADATLKLDDYQSRSTAATRTFVTPPLEQGKVY